MTLRSLYRLVVLFLFTGACSHSVAPAATAETPTARRAHQPEKWLRQGQDALRRGDTVRAEQYLALAFNKGDSPGKVLPGLLQACIEGSRLRAALGYAETYARAHPERYSLRYLVATILVSLGQSHDAVVELEALVQDNPRHPMAHYLLGVLWSENDAATAEGHFQSYLRLKSQGARAAEVRGHLRRLSRRRTPASLTRGARAPVSSGSSSASILEVPVRSSSPRHRAVRSLVPAPSESIDAIVWEKTAP